MDSTAREKAPANDAQLVQNVRSALGRGGLSSDLNISSCGFIVTLHGAVRDGTERRGVEETVRRIEGVRGVVNRIRVPVVPQPESCFSLPENG